MANQGTTTTSPAAKPAPATPPANAAEPGKPSALLDTRVGYRYDSIELLAKLPNRTRAAFFATDGEHVQKTHVVFSRAVK